VERKKGKEFFFFFSRKTGMKMEWDRENEWKKQERNKIEKKNTTEKRK
jgi:hypothetical protein